MDLNPSLSTDLKGIKLVTFDIDGVLTDGRLFYGADGEMLKTFNVKDGVAMKLLPQWGVEVAVISAKDSAPLSRRMLDLKVTHFYPGSHDKLEVLQGLIADLGLSLNEVLYVGDDVIDLKVMQVVGVSVCPADAHRLVCERADIVAPVCGGQGVARWVADLILEQRMPLAQAYAVAQQAKFEK